ncbi:hypothetical protein LEM8419_00112 [Neolewinella maritima]|uniref:N-acetyltransferase domain-containing protein n=1 Tax=Neolewinella maritima TaxID=1383882 RepID=A0ABN8F3Z5_9BACT|nr:GNAT family N-acetyltransferase [Neolewinella maritima]CAH0998764.1 hypothetical protein LEM8419_00112 [Neolewinella maritima]
MIRFATRADLPVILNFIRQLADYEKLAHEVTATEADLERTLFGEQPAAEVVIAEHEGAPAGFALFFRNYSTFLGKPGLYLEDLFVLPELRGKGIGKTLLQFLAHTAVQRGYGRFEWSVLDWNTPAVEFYRAIGAEPMEGWTVQRVTGTTLQELAASYT